MDAIDRRFIEFQQAVQTGDYATAARLKSHLFIELLTQVEIEKDSIMQKQLRERLSLEEAFLAELSQIQTLAAQEKQAALQYMETSHESMHVIHQQQLQRLYDQHQATLDKLKANFESGMYALQQSHAQPSSLSSRSRPNTQLRRVQTSRHTSGNQLSPQHAESNIPRPRWSPALLELHRMQLLAASKLDVSLLFHFLCQPLTTELSVCSTVQQQNCRSAQLHWSTRNSLNSSLEFKRISSGSVIN